MSIQELARYYLAQGKTVSAAGLMLSVIEQEPIAENLLLLAEIYAKQGLHSQSAALHLRVLKAELGK
jgi:hypothetical protein